MYANEIARVCHEANRAMRCVLGESDDGGWDEVSEETRASAVDGVLAVQNGATPEESHKNWCKFKSEHGWTYGPVKSEDLKEHPCLVPYDKLPEEQRVKDHLFVAVVNALS